MELPQAKKPLTIVRTVRQSDSYPDYGDGRIYDDAEGQQPEEINNTKKAPVSFAYCLYVQALIVIIILILAVLVRFVGGKLFVEARDAVRLNLSKSTTFAEAYNHFYKIKAGLSNIKKTIQNSLKPPASGSDSTNTVTGSSSSSVSDTDSSSAEPESDSGSDGSSSDSSLAPSTESEATGSNTAGTTQSPTSSDNKTAELNFSKPDIKSSDPAVGGGRIIYSMAKSDGLKPPPTGASFAPFALTAAFEPPLKSYTITSEFGYRIHPISGSFGFHSGIDLAVDLGTAVLSPVGGKVKEVGSSEVYGEYIVIEHSPQVESFFGHCDSVFVKKGERVKKGEVIALVGTTGMSTGYHLHYEIRIDGKAHDPKWILPNTE